MDTGKICFNDNFQVIKVESLRARLEMHVQTLYGKGEESHETETEINRQIWMPFGLRRMLDQKLIPLPSGRNMTKKKSDCPGNRILIEQVQ